MTWPGWQEALSVRGLVGVAVVCAALVHATGESAWASAPPEGPHLAFTAMTELRRDAFSVRVVAAEGVPMVTLVRGSRHGITPRPRSKVSWSADGTRLAFAGSKEARRGIYTVRAGGTGLRVLRGVGDGSSPIFSADGSKMAFARLQFGKNNSFGTSVWVADAEGRGAFRLTAMRDGVEYLPSSFSSDGLTLAVTKTRLGSGKPLTLLFRLDGSGRKRVLARRASEAAFSPDGSKIVVVRHSTLRHQEVLIVHRDLQVMSIDGKTIWPLTRTQYIAESYPSWDPSGERVAFIAFRISKDPFDALFDDLLPIGNSIVQINADGSCRQRILSLKDAALFGPAWQPGTGREAGRIEC
jgi:Tol biopolymer transport system component